jgi:exo-beta-1,3-glucanase (GH17 family)
MKKGASNQVFRIVTQWAVLSLLVTALSCNFKTRDNTKYSKMNDGINASDILGNPAYLAISYGGYRETTRDIQPTLTQLKNDMRILSAMGVKVLRTYNTHYDQAGNLLQAIRELKSEDANFKMYVMLGIWIDCENAWTGITPNHDAENLQANTEEVERAVSLAQKYPDIVKILAVGNEAMVKWAANYYVQPNIILKWVNHLQHLKKTGELNRNLWITSSDNFASWGGGDSIYHCEDLEKLIRAVDYVSLHTYPMHDTHYHPIFWGVTEEELKLPKTQAIDQMMDRAVQYAKEQYASTVNYIYSIDSTKEVHIGETGWASASSGLYGPNGSNACDEYKEGLYYQKIRNWTRKEGIACFYFEAFNEKWKDAENAGGSENHFGLFKINGQAKYAVWDLVDQGVFKGLVRNGNPIVKTYNGQLDSLLEEVFLPPVKQFSEL